ncbi:RHS repeat-associated core domain-containing protein [Lentzea sp. NPDC004789]
MSRWKLALALGLVPVLMAGTAAASSAAPGYQRQTAQQHPLVQGRDATPLPFKDGADDEAARTAVPAPVWPGTEAVTARAGLVPVGAQVLGRRGSFPLVVKLGAAKEKTSTVTLDYAKFRTAFGADYGNRLRLVSLPDCALSTPDKAECAAVPLASSNDGTRVTGEAPSGAMVALASAPEGGTGDFKATDVKASSKWEAGGSSGDFTWSYPLRVPPSIEGPAPSLALGYSAQSVDGMTAATNNQPSWIGEGFDLSTGYIERSYRTCADDMGNGALNTTKSSDLCWFSDNAVLSLGGRTTELIKDAQGGYHAKSESGMRIEKKTGAANGDDNGEHWVVTDQDGVQHWFGRQRIPGWTEGKPETQSVFTVPVYGNHADEPCRQATWAASSCNQAWRWNFDYVVDPHGNSMSLWYTKETNKYAKSNDVNNAVDYVRAGYLTRIDYGTRTESEFGAVPAQVTFETADRCDANCGTKDATTWKDVPWDLECTKTPCLVGAPTFWGTKRLGRVTTLSGGRKVDEWTLQHSYPVPGDNTRAGLWLERIKHAGLLGDRVDLPDVRFSGVAMPNRVAGFDSSAPLMKWFRVNDIRTELGGEISVTYSDPECVAGSKMPGAPENNTLRCHPAYWTRAGQTEPAIDYFHKYVATAVSEVDHTGLAPVKTTTYDYLGPGAWHFAEDDGLAPEKYKTWSSWRGYEKVRATEGTGESARYSETTYFRGMDGDRLPGDNKRTGVVITDATGGKVADTAGLEGIAREKRTLTGPGGTEISAELFEPWQSNPTASRTVKGITTNAAFVAEGVVRHRVALDGGRGYQRTLRRTEYDDKTGVTLLQNDLGDEARTDDDQCTRWEHVSNTGVWLIGLEARERVYSLSCDKEPTSEDEIVSDVRTYYDDGTPTKGDVTRTEEISAFKGGVYSYETIERATYDAHGREKEAWDARGAKTTTAYSPEVGGPVTKVTETNALGHTTATALEPAWAGAELSTTDANGKVTSQAYDGLGRLTAVWKPGREKGKADPHARFGYQIREGAPVAVTSESLHPDDVRYVTTTALFDGFARPRQTQQPGPTGVRIIGDTIYDDAGRVTKQNPGYPVSGAPNTSLFVALADNSIINQKVTTFDAADRPVVQIVNTYGKEQSRTTTRYGGDRVDVTPPKGGIATSTVTDNRDRKVELRQYKGGQPTGAYESTKYTYTKKNQQETVVDPAGNTWRYGYDVRGRRTSETDPDSGTTVVTYNNAADKTSVTDSLGRKLVHTYDELGRKKGVFEGSETGPQRSAVTYDTVANGQVASTTRFQDGKAFKTEITGYDGRYQPTGTKITVPETPATPLGKLAGTYEFKNTYKSNGSLATSTYPKAGKLDTEVIEYGYDDQGQPKVLKSKIGLTGGETTYVAGTQYTNLGQPGVYTMATSDTAKMVETGFTYADDGRLSVTKTTKETGDPLVSQVRNSFDAAGNVTKTQDGADTQCFQYDHLQRMTEAWTPKSGDCTTAVSAAVLGGPAPYWQSFGYDPVGNRTSRVQHATTKGDVKTTYAYPLPGKEKPHALTSTTTEDDTGKRTASYSYDGVGNTKTRPGAQGEQTLTYDVEGNLAASADTAGTSSFVDDADGNRLVSADAAGTTLHLSNMQLRFVKATGTVEPVRFYSYGGSVVAQRNLGGVTWLVTDEQGTANVAITESDQSVTQRRQTPFGEVRSASATWPNNQGFLFGAQTTTGLTDVGVRQYDADAGRFTTVDPIVNPDEPQALNAYAYANNSPVSFTDPTGLSWNPMGDEGDAQQAAIQRAAQLKAQARVRAAAAKAAMQRMIAAKARAEAAKNRAIAAAKAARARAIQAMQDRLAAAKKAAAQARAMAAKISMARTRRPFASLDEMRRNPDFNTYVNDVGETFGSYLFGHTLAGCLEVPIMGVGCAILSEMTHRGKEYKVYVREQFVRFGQWASHRVVLPVAYGIAKGLYDLAGVPQDFYAMAPLHKPFNDAVNTIQDFGHWLGGIPDRLGLPPGLGGRCHSRDAC